MKVPKIVLDEAEKRGYNRVRYIGKRDGHLAFSVAYYDKSGHPCPTGLPNIFLLDGDKITIVGGFEALELL